ncbi:MAG: molybdenum ABC transporter ATP-binding protein [Alphaproteobacteria bacterium]|nr:molybdenum ABC transporter ATP-binding protein [Alphaproteobacteria bacterium]MCW5741975.1 molybdenum ABC transporter ATP-binding protein [Alphaproteobacteria bacterium]
MIEVDIALRIGDFDLAAAFDAPAGSVTALFGRSGSGKSTIIDCVAGLRRPDRGRVVVEGETLFADGGTNVPPEGRRLGYVFQDARLFPHLSVVSNLRYGERGARGGRRIASFDDVVALLGIGHLLERRPGTLSGGERQRVAIGRALLSQPRALLMDEPLAALDRERKAEVLPYIERLRDRFGLPILYVSHAVEEVVRLAQKVVRIEHGRITGVGPVEEMLSGGAIGDEHGPASVLRAVLKRHDGRFGLTVLEVGAGRELVTPAIEQPIGDAVRVRILARDVSLALEVPTGISIQNRLEATIADMARPSRFIVDVKLDIGAPLWSRVSAKAAEELALAPGKRVVALIKTVALERE